MSKRYVKIIAEFAEDGRITPLKLIWDDGQGYEITKILDVSRAASTVGGTGYRYEVIIEGKRRSLYLEDVVFNKAIGARFFVAAKE